MKQTKILAAVSLAALVASMGGCGGGGDAEAGSPTVLSVVPSTLTATAATTANGGPPAGHCSAGYGGEFFVYGGSAPYRIDNTAPDAMVINKTTVDDRGGSFTVNFTGTCIAPAIITVVDKLNHNVQIILNNKPAG